MRQTAYRIYFKNGKEKIVYGFSFKEAIILGLTHAIHEGWHCDIDKIIDDHNHTIHEINISFDYHQENI